MYKHLKKKTCSYSCWGAVKIIINKRTIKDVITLISNCSPFKHASAKKHSHLLISAVDS